MQKEHVKTLNIKTNRHLHTEINILTLSIEHFYILKAKTWCLFFCCCLLIKDIIVWLVNKPGRPQASGTGTNQEKGRWLLSTKTHSRRDHTACVCVRGQKHTSCLILMCPWLETEIISTVMKQVTFIDFIYLSQNLKPPTHTTPSILTRKNLHKSGKINLKQQRSW